MKKYVVKYKNSEKIFGEYSCPYEASDKLMAYLLGDNSYLDEDCLSLFDFVLEEVEVSVADLIPDFESAKRYLKLKGPNKKNIEALIALDQLFTIAEAWNKADGFVPDFSDWDQAKYYPWFKYDKDAAGFVYVHTYYSATTASAYFGPRLCFMTSERAEQFGTKFSDLYNKVFLINK